MSSLELKIGGDGGPVSMATLAKCIDALTKLVREVSPDAPEPHVIDIRMGSVAVASDISEVDSKRVVTGLDTIASQHVRPAGWSDRALGRASDLVKATSAPDAAGSAVRLPGVVVALTVELGARISRVLQQPRPVVTSLRGRLYEYSHRWEDSAVQARLASTSGGVVQLVIPADLSTQTLGLLEHQVEVWGALTRADGQTRNMQVWGLEASPDVAPVATLPGVPEWAKQLPDGWDPVSAVRELRDAI